MDNLSVSEKEAVTEYTGTRYKNINAALRGEESAFTGRNVEFAENVSSALKKADVPEDVVVYRGASKGAIGELKDLPKEEMIGKVIEDKDGDLLYAACLKKATLHRCGPPWAMGRGRGPLGRLGSGHANKLIVQF